MSTSPTSVGTQRGPQQTLPYALIRGGTSKCHCFRMEDLPEDEAERDALLLAALGSPDARQIDGVGGATSLTSKVLLIREPTRSEPDADIVFCFAQVSVTDPVVDYGGTCGNCTAAVAHYAVDNGFVEPAEPTTTVRIYNLNTSSVVIAEVPVQNGRAAIEGDAVIAGVPGSGASVRLWFDQPTGVSTGTLYPSGSDCDELRLADSTFEVSFIDVVNPIVFVSAEEVDLSGDELPDELLKRTNELQKLEQCRGWGAQVMGLVEDAENAAATTPGVPKVAAVAPPRDYRTTDGSFVKSDDIDLCARIMSMGKPHAAYSVSGAICTAVAATTPGTTPYAVSGAGLDLGEQHTQIRIGHPSGVIDAIVERDEENNVLKAGIIRTARHLVEGVVLVPTSQALH